MQIQIKSEKDTSGALSVIFRKSHFCQFLPLLLFVFPSYGVTVTWDGDAGDGEWNTATNWDSDQLPGSDDEVVIHAAGAVNIAPGNYTVQSVLLSGASELTVADGAVLAISGSDAEKALDISSDASKVTCNGTIDVSGTNNGVFSNGSLIIGTSGELSTDNTDGYGLRLEGSFSNSGIVNISNFGQVGGAIFGLYSRIGIHVNEESGKINIVGSAPNSSGTGHFVATIFRNKGEYNISDPSGRLRTGIFVQSPTTFTNMATGVMLISGVSNVGVSNDENFTNAGTLTINTPGRTAFTSDGPMSNTGFLAGVGFFQIFSNLGGIIAPGTSPGIMQFTSLTASASSTIEIEVDGTTPDTEHDVIEVNGTATISGTLSVSINYTPSDGDRIVFIDANNVSGTFSTIDPALPTDWSLDYSVAGEVAIVFSEALPIELSTFTAREESQNIVLQWETVSENNNEGFEIEHSLNSIDWEYLGFVPGKGNTILSQQYNFVHKSPKGKNNFYRLKQLDFDGKFEYTNIVSVYFSADIGEENVWVYPNPFRGQLNILNGEGMATLFNAAGQLVSQYHILEKEVKIQTEDLLRGTYFLRIQGESEKAEVVKIVKIGSF